MTGLEYAIMKSGLKHKEIAEVLGCKQPQINDWKSKKRPIPKHHLSKLASLLNVDEELLTKEINVSFDGINEVEVIKESIIKNEWNEVVSIFEKNNISPDQAKELIKIFMKLKSL